VFPGEGGTYEGTKKENWSGLSPSRIIILIMKGKKGIEDIRGAYLGMTLTR